MTAFGQKIHKIKIMSAKWFYNL